MKIVPPPHWGQDGLSDFLQSAHENSFATFYSKKTAYSLLHDIDKFFFDFIENLINPKQHLETLLFCRTHSLFRGAVRLAVSGQVVESYPLLRTVLESAGYGHFIYSEIEQSSNLSHGDLTKPDKTPTRLGIWLNRDQGEAEKRICQNCFTIAAVRNEIENRDSETGRSPESIAIVVA